MASEENIQKRPSGRPSTGKSDYTFARARLPKDLHKKFKLLCTEKDLVMEDVIRSLIEDWVKKNS